MCCTYCACCGGKGVPTGPVVSQEEWEAWERDAKVPTIYDPPQKREFRWCTSTCLYPCMRSSCCGCTYCLRATVCGPCCGRQTVRISSPDKWLAEMLERSNPNCPDKFKGVWWMQDNVAGEGVVTLQDGSWETPSMMRKSSNNNWTVDAYSFWGVWLTGHFWVQGGNHLFEVSPNGRWTHISVLTTGSHWMYELREGDELKRPDGTPLDFAPGDFLRVSYMEMSSSSAIKYQYLLRRVAHLDGDGNVVKTPAWGALEEASKRSAAGAGVLPHIRDAQSLLLAPKDKRTTSSTAAANASGEASASPPVQQSMGGGSSSAGTEGQV